ncbi:hypothetical protein KSP39_PZI007913 [Platanthera zijinensis]|uniref:Retrotransposon gag domain-containing protein n=1 Tax=Platanthera zijinensis TaxID=2320716 RepID=A0AAP0BNH4_9ASPA
MGDRDQHQRSTVRMEVGQSSTGAPATSSPATNPTSQQGTPQAPDVVLTPPAPVPFQQTEMGQTLTAILESFRAQQAPAPQPNPGANWMTVFRGLSPPSYQGTESAVHTEEWLDTIYEMLAGIRCPTEEAVALAVSCLESHGKRWWKSQLDTTFAGVDCADITWEEFRAALLGHFVPQSARDDLEDRFLRLRQGSRTVVEYYQEFTHLARYADAYQLDDAGYARRFYKGLQDDMRQALLFVSEGSLARILEMAKKREADQLIVRSRKRPAEDTVIGGRRDRPRGQIIGERRNGEQPRQ